MKVSVNNQTYSVYWSYVNTVLEQAMIAKQLVKADLVREDGKPMNKAEVADLLGLDSYPEPKFTYCIIKNDEDGTIAASQCVTLHHKDKHDKEKARKFSLAKALDTLFPSAENTDVSDDEIIANKEARGAFWTAYLSRPRLTNEQKEKAKALNAVEIQ